MVESMTKALDEGLRPSPEGSLVLIWVQPEEIAFAMTGPRKSLLSLVRASAGLVRAVAEIRHLEAHPEGARLRKSAIRELAAELFIRAAQPQHCTTKAQDRTADVILEIQGPHVDIFRTELVTLSELERAAAFLLRSTFQGCMTSGTVASPVEFTRWLEELACDTFSKPIKKAEDRADDN
jgi:hypothetical protein